MKFCKFILVLFLVFLCDYSFSQCRGSKKLIDTCNEKLQDFKYEQHFEFYLPGDGKTTELSFPITMTKGNTYKLQFESVEKFNSVAIVNINHSTKKYLVASSFNPGTGKYENYIEFECKTTVAVEIKISIKDNKEGCGVCVLGVKS
jgi:hypothetical protein